MTEELKCSNNKDVPFQKLQSNFPLAILGTAGTRLLSHTHRVKLWKDLQQLVIPFLESKKSHIKVETLQTIPGEAEGYFGFLAVNLLTKRIGGDLQM